MITDNKYQICYPGGGGGNHLRWLMFLDDSMVCESLPDIASKLNFIKTEIYPEQRKWFNWLYYEGKFNDIVKNTYINVHHTGIYEWEYDPTWEDQHILYMDFTDAQVPYQHITQMLLNGQFVCTTDKTFTPTVVYDEITGWLNELNLIKNSNKLTSTKKIINAHRIFDQNLSREFYNEVREFFKLTDDRYDEASLIHQWYYASRVRSAKEYYSYYSSDLFASTLKGIGEFGNNVI